MSVPRWWYGGSRWRLEWLGLRLTLEFDPRDTWGLGARLYRLRSIDGDRWLLSVHLLCFALYFSRTQGRR